MAKDFGEEESSRPSLNNGSKEMCRILGVDPSSDDPLGHCERPVSLQKHQGSGSQSEGRKPFGDQISCTSDIYIMIHNSSKVRVMK